MVFHTRPDLWNFPDLDLLYADRVLLRKPALPVERISHGGLVTHMMNASLEPLGIFLSLGHVLAVKLESQSVEDRCQAIMDSADQVAAGAGHTFTVADGNLKTKMITVDGFNLDITATLNGSSNIGYILSQILLPSLPWYSASSLINRLESLCWDMNWSWLIYVSQRSETIRLKALPLDGTSAPIPHFPTWYAAQSDPPEVFAAFDTSLYLTPVVGKQGWE